jgi:hypothetical protein
MDCEKFESAMMEELYGDLDELTSAAAKRHLAGCARCAERIAGLRATRRLAAALPLVAPPAGLGGQILAAAHEAQTNAPMRFRVAHAVSLAGSWAMRPQTAMAAVFLVMIGTSVLLLRGKAHAPTSAEVTVREQGTPAPPSAAEDDEATRAFDSPAPADPNAELLAARSVRAEKGCRAAVTRFDRLSQRAPGTPPGWDALLEGALCYRALGNFNEARVRLSALLRVDSHKDRARAELERLDQIQQSVGTLPSGVKASPRTRPVPATNPPVRFP